MNEEQGHDQEKHNIYSPPESIQSSDSFRSEDITLATRGQRFLASIIDSIIIAVITVPMVIFLISSGIVQGGRYGEIGLGATLLLSAASIGIYFLINGAFLYSTGQTIGKKALSIKIINYETGKKASSGAITGRYLFYLGVGIIPIIGGIASLVNICFIFGNEKRCIHDLLAGTKVVKC